MAGKGFAINSYLQVNGIDTSKKVKDDLGRLFSGIEFQPKASIRVLKSLHKDIQNFLNKNPFEVKLNVSTAELNKLKKKIESTIGISIKSGAFAASGETEPKTRKTRARAKTPETPTVSTALVVRQTVQTQRVFNNFALVLRDFTRVALAASLALSRLNNTFSRTFTGFRTLNIGGPGGGRRLPPPPNNPVGFPLGSPQNPRFGRRFTPGGGGFGGGPPNPPGPLALPGPRPRRPRTTNITEDPLVELGRQAGQTFRRFAVYTAVTAGFYAVATSIRTATQALIDFDREQLRLTQIIKGPQSQIKDLTTQSRELGESLGISSQELLGAATTLAQANFKPKEIETLLDVIAKTAVAPTFDSIPKTVEGVIAVFKQFDIPVSRALDVFNKINIVAADFAVEAQDVIDVVTRAGGAFANATDKFDKFGNKVDKVPLFEELLAVTTAVRQSTRISAETIGTAFKTISARLNRKDTIDFLKSFNIELEKFDELGKRTGQTVTPLEAFSRIVNRFQKGDLTQIERSSIVEQIAGLRALSVATPLLNNFVIAQEALKKSILSGNTLQENVNEANDSLAKSLDRLAESFKNANARLAESSGLKALASGLADAAAAASKFISVMGPALPILAAVIGTKGLFSGAKLASGFSQGFFGSGRNVNLRNGRRVVERTLLSDIFANRTPGRGERVFRATVSRGLRRGRVGLAAAGAIGAGLLTDQFDDFDAQSSKRQITQSRAIGAAGGAVSGAFTGGLIGSQFPGFGTAIGAVIGGLIGLTNALSSSAKQITEIGVETSQKALTKSIKDLNPKGDFAANFLGFGDSGRTFNNFNNALENRINKGLIDAGLDTGIAPSRGINKFDDIQREIEILGQAAIDRPDLARGLNNRIRLLSNTRNEVFSNRAKILSSPEIQRDLREAVVKFTDEGFTSKHKNLQSLIGKIAAGTVAGEGLDPLRGEGLKRFREETEKLTSQVDQLASSVVRNKQRFLELSEASGALVSFFNDLARSSDRANVVLSKVGSVGGRFGGFENALSFPSSATGDRSGINRALLGQGKLFGDTSAARSFKQITDVRENFFNFLVEADKSNIDKFKESVFEFINSVEKDLPKGVGALLGASLSTLEGKTAEEILAQVSAGNLSEFVNTLFNPILEPLENQGKLMGKVADNLFKTMIETFNEAEELFTRAREVSAAALDIEESRSQFGIDTSRGALRFSARDSISRLNTTRGLRFGQNALDPAALGKNLEEALNRRIGINQELDILARSGGTAEQFKALSSELSKVESDAKKYEEALKSLGDTTTEIGAITKELSDIEAERSQRLSIAERILTNDPAANNRLNRGAFLASRARNGGLGGLAQQGLFSLEDRKILFEFLRTFQDVKIFGDQTGGQFAEQLLGPLANLKGEDRRNELLNQAGEIFTRAESAFNTLSKVLNEFGNKLTNLTVQEVGQLIIEAGGGKLNIPKNATGGPVRAINKALSGRDSELIAAEPGEFIVNKRDAQRNKALLNTINSGGLGSDEILSPKEMRKARTAEAINKRKNAKLSRDVDNSILRQKMMKGSIFNLDGSLRGFFKGGTVEQTKEIAALQNQIFFLNKQRANVSKEEFDLSIAPELEAAKARLDALRVATSVDSTIDRVAGLKAAAKRSPGLLPLDKRPRSTFGTTKGGASRTGPTDVGGGFLGEPIRGNNGIFRGGGGGNPVDINSLNFGQKRAIQRDFLRRQRLGKTLPGELPGQSLQPDYQQKLQEFKDKAKLRNQIFRGLRRGVSPTQEQLNQAGFPQNPLDVLEKRATGQFNVPAENLAGRKSSANPFSGDSNAPNIAGFTDSVNKFNQGITRLENMPKEFKVEIAPVSVSITGLDFTNSLTDEAKKRIADEIWKSITPQQLQERIQGIK